ncbi:glycosyltransferase family 4 protein [Halobellus ordinarius]|uniref:glycosyltransferase family 4 protein n=1 Tax=Halobellus ordinarius TaxID=3075120 RepID=UPI002880B980|nr:glycosyltransferase family 4 protein [Halobellus sp. ZY16]
MKLCYVTSRYRPHIGGVETHVAELATRFADRGHEVVVVSADRGTRGDGRRLPAHEYVDGVWVKRVRALAPGGAVHVSPAVLRAVERVDPDLVHAHNYHSLPLTFAAAAVERLDDVPLVVTPHYHGGSASGLRDHLLSLYRPIGKWALHRADAVLAVSNWEARQLANDFDLSAQVVPNGVNVGRFRAAVPATGPSDHPYLLCVGRLERYKGVQHAIRALVDLPEYDLVVAGTGPFDEDLQRIAIEAGVDDRVTFAGFIPDEDLPSLYTGAAAFLALSSFEAYGITVAEALAAGTPCVVREAGALVDWADRSDCVGVTPDGVAEGVREAVERPAPTGSLPTWGDVAEQVATVYGAVQ